MYWFGILVVVAEAETQALLLFEVLLEALGMLNELGNNLLIGLVVEQAAHCNLFQVGDTKVLGALHANAILLLIRKRPLRDEAEEQDFLLVRRRFESEHEVEATWTIG